jgi:predicted MPP superfamily phosphohydrolase
MSKENKSNKGIAGKIVMGIFVTIVFISIAIAAANFGCYITVMSRVNEYTAIGNEDAVKPEKDKNGEWVFKTDRELKIVDLSDIHIGSGFLSVSKDKSAVNAIAAMITEEKPDLVVISGDSVFPVPFISGTFNNKYETNIIIQLMENLGVYWAPILGNHDSEIYSLYNREAISELYANDELTYCLYQKGPDGVDGYGNYVIHVRNSKNELTQELIFMDSNAYTKKDPFGTKWDYDNIHSNQISWYRSKIEKAQAEKADVKSLVFIHIPPEEMQIALYEYWNNDNKDTKDVKYISGEINAEEPYVYCSNHSDQFFETALEMGSTQAIFFAHDHRNNMVLNYKGIDLIYNYSVDYLALKGISKEKPQRGCTVITVNTGGTYSQQHKNYYENYYDNALYHEDIVEN